MFRLTQKYLTAPLGIITNKFVATENSRETSRAHDPASVYKLAPRNKSVFLFSSSSTRIGMKGEKHWTNKNEKTDNYS